MNSMLHKIYLDNASTTFPKPECVPDAMADFIRYQGTNINCGTYAAAYDTEKLYPFRRAAL